jgi:hypothetical protein
MSAPWYAHLLTGGIAILAGLALVHLGQADLGAVIVGSGVSFLGVGVGTVASTPTSTPKT